MEPPSLPYFTLCSTGGTPIGALFHFVFYWWRPDRSFISLCLCRTGGATICPLFHVVFYWWRPHRCLISLCLYSTGGAPSTPLLHFYFYWWRPHQCLILNCVLLVAPLISFYFLLMAHPSVPYFTLCYSGGTPHLCIISLFYWWYCTLNKL